MNHIIPFKGRTIDYGRPVRIYRNLHAKTDEHKYSILQGGLVRGHTNCLMLTGDTFDNVRFLVNKRIQSKVRANKRKLVHAFIEGRIVDRAMGTEARQDATWPGRITYNPHTDDTFVWKSPTNQSFPVSGALAVLINNSGVYGACLS